MSESLKQARQLSILSFCVKGGQPKNRSCNGFRNTPTTHPSDNSPRLIPPSSGESLSQVQPRLDFSANNEDIRNDCSCVTTGHSKEDEDYEHVNNYPSNLTERPQSHFQQDGDDHQTHVQHDSNYSLPSMPLDQEIDSTAKSTKTSLAIANTSSLDVHNSFNNIRNATTHDSEQQPMKPKNKPLSQLFLDFGQSSFGVRTLCETCGMLYDKHLPEDVRQHIKVCRNYELGVPFQSQEGRIVARFQSSGNISSNVSGIGDHVVEIRPSDSASLLKKLAQVQQIVDQELGAAPAHDGAITTTSSNSRSQDHGNRENGRAEHNENRRRKNNRAQSTTGTISTTSNARSVATAYLYIKDRRVVGLVTVETIRCAYRAKNQWERHLNPERATMGIRHLWVHSRARKMGIATRMVDSARCKLVFGLVVPRDEIAFSSPTQSGLLFAQKYCGCVRSNPDSSRSGDDVDDENSPVGTNKSNEDVDTAGRTGNILVYRSTASAA